MDMSTVASDGLRRYDEVVAEKSLAGRSSGYS